MKPAFPAWRPSAQANRRIRYRPYKSRACASSCKVASRHAGNDTYIYDPLNYLVVSVTLPIVGQIIEASAERPYLCLCIGVDRMCIGELLLQAGPALVSTPASERGMYVAKTDGPLLDAVVRLVRLLDRPRDAQVLAPLILREIHYRALTGEFGMRLRELCMADSQIQRIARAIDVLRSRFVSPRALLETILL